MADLLADLQALAGAFLWPASLVGSGVALAALVIISLLDAVQELIE